MRLDNVRVLDLSHLLPGPFGTQLLADMGAEIINVGRPSGDTGPVSRFDAVNQGKKSIGIDLKQEDGREAFLRLAEDADVVFEQFRPGVVDRLGIGYEDVRERAPDIVYCSLTGYGQTGPYRDRVGHDLNYVGFAGFLDMTRPTEADPPTIPGYPIADVSGGIYAALSIVSALLDRELGSGTGEYLDVSMMEATMSFSEAVLQEAVAGDNPRPGKTLLTGQQPCYGVYECADGRYVTLAAVEPKFWAEFCDVVARDDLRDAHMSQDEAERAALRAELEDLFQQQTAEEWEAELGEEDVMFGLVHTPREMLDDPHVSARETVTKTENVSRMGHPVRTREGPIAAGDGLADPGEHTAELLAAAGYASDEIESLRRDGVI